MSVASLQPRDWFELIVEGLPDAILMVDLNLRIAFMNRRAELMFGYMRSELIGEPLDVLIPTQARPSLQGWVSEFMSSQTRDAHAATDLTALHKSGAEISVYVGLSSMAADEGQFALASFTDSTERMRSEEAEQRMAALVDSAEDAIISKTLDGVIRSWNPGAERLLGYSPDEMIGQSVLRLLPDDRQDEESTIIDRIKAGQRVDHFETMRRRRDGSLADVSLTVSPIRDRAGKIVGASKILRDIGDRRSNEDALRQANEKLQQANADLENFVYTASHDLRSPLNGVNSVVQWILDDDQSLSRETRERLGLIHSRIERMRRLLNDIRDYARMGQFEQPAEVPLTAAALVADTVAMSDMRPGFSVRIDPALAEIAVARVPLEQVFHNLINNAIKHHDRSTGTVQISVERGASTLRFSVIDDGPGVPAEYRDEIFDLFKTLKPRDSVEGSGMGLALVRRIVTKMGGHCGVRPAGNRGSDFWFDWPQLQPRSEEKL